MIVLIARRLVLGSAFDKEDGSGITVFSGFSLMVSLVIISIIVAMINIFMPDTVQHGTEHFDIHSC